MGMIWRFTMPLLSTLAALVIIVHSAEEELDPGFSRDLRPRAVEEGTNSYEQPWKAIDGEPLKRQSGHADTWVDHSPEEPRALHRPVRKRKRRPKSSSEIEPEETYPDNPQKSYSNTEYPENHQSEFERRRRKRPDVRPYRWIDEPEENRERPLRRRVLRKKRPTLDNISQGEYNVFTPNDDERDDKPKIDDDERDDKPRTEKTEIRYTEDFGYPKNAQDYYFDPDRITEDYKESDDSKEEIATEIDEGKSSITSGMHASKYNPDEHLNKQEEIKAKAITKISTTGADTFATEEYAVDDEGSQALSEFSMDVLHSKSLAKFNGNDDGKILSKSGNNNFLKKTQAYGPIDPVTLKLILKRSNGTSLSEILQRHNLSLADLLHGRGDAISVFNKDASEHPLEDVFPVNNPSEKVDSKIQMEKEIIASGENAEITNQVKTPKIIERATNLDNENAKNSDNKNNTETEQREDLLRNEESKSRPRMTNRRRFPTGIRRKLRMRPMLNSTLKTQFSRDLLALSAKKYSHNNRNVSKSREWKDIVTVMANRNQSKDDISKIEVVESVLTTDTPIETTISELENHSSAYLSPSDVEKILTKDNEVELISISTTEATTTTATELLLSEIDTETEKPKIMPILRPAANASVLRRQAFSNRLKRKRLKQKSSTTEQPGDDLTKNFFGMANLVSSSEFIERTQKPCTTTAQDNTEYATELEDFMTTAPQTTVNNEDNLAPMATSRFASTLATKSPLSKSSTTTEQSAKFEIEEILNDTMTSERLAKILHERNMTLSELVKHRERGSSHVHLADIFHNASKEPNPPEPFLSKSSIEPISKETYPLRAILEANTHDAVARPTAEQTRLVEGNGPHIPVVMDFGNNVNENGENMGIMSLFNIFSGNNTTLDKTDIKQDSDGTPYVSSVVSVNTTNTNDTDRESRVLGDDNSIDAWSELFLLMNNNINKTGIDLPNVAKGALPIDKSKVLLEEDVDGDGVIILEDLQHLKDFDSNIASGSDEKLEIKMYERSETVKETPGILNKLPSNTKSVAIATASILGLATILFLLTYIAFKYKQQRSTFRKKDSFCDVRIPSPVFENRKSHKNNCSSRSISPMITNSNIYTMSTLDSHNGKDSPDYMWNSLRKPFQ